MAEHDTVQVLNRVIVAAQDEEKGFAEAADIADDPKLKLLFKDCAQRCRDATAELREQVRALGEDPQKRGSVAGAARRGWTEVKAAVKDSNLAALEELEHEQDHARAAYLRALNTRLPAGVMHLLQRQYDGVVDMHDRIRDLRDQYGALT